MSSILPTYNTSVCRIIYNNFSKGLCMQQKFEGVKVFSATMRDQRADLGDVITKWIADHPQYEIVDKVVTQSSDEAFHCLAITFFYKSNSTAKVA